MPHLAPNIKVIKISRKSMIYWQFQGVQKSNNPFKHTHGWIHSNALGVNNHPCFLKSKIVLEWKHALLPFWLVITVTLLTNRCSTKKQPTVVGNLNDVSLCASTSKTFKQIFLIYMYFHIVRFIWWHVDCSACGLNIIRLKRKNNIKEKTVLF